VKVESAKPNCLACASAIGLRFGAKAPAHWRCPRCGLECIWPQPDDETLAEIYQASYFAHYQNTNYENTIDPRVVRAMKRATYGRQLQRMPLSQRVGRLLDCGAATGFLCELAKDLKWDAFALEISQFGAEACSKLLGSDHVYQGEVQQAKFAANREGQFEAITMFDFIEHVRDPGEVLEWARGKLVPGGILLLTTPRVGTVSWRVMGQQWFHYTSREHLWFFSDEAIGLLLTRAGFRSIEVRALPKAVTVGYALAHYARETSYSRLFSPLARAVSPLLPKRVKSQRLWFYLGEMSVLAKT
jgi:2-polyprenyl-3-methyl-5-hydroxy-6-metoxy-1,4-benzoquinol methylase